MRRYVRAYVEAIHYFKAGKKEPCRSCANTHEWKTGVLEHTQDWFYTKYAGLSLPPLDGYQVVLQEMVSTNPKASTLNVKELVDARFVKELEDGGFVASLGKK